MAEVNQVSDEKSVKRRGKFVGFWATEDQHEQLRQDAATAGLTVSDYLRQLVTDAPVPVKAPAPVAARLEVGKFLGQLGKIGSNMNQLAHNANHAALVGDWSLMPGAKAILQECQQLNALLIEVRDTLHSALNRGK